MTADGRPPSRPRLVVGVGASAGGLEAFKELLRVLPADSGMSFLLVQHLDPTHESLLVELLQPHTPMPVRDADDGLELRPDTVYVIRPGTNIGIRHARIELSAPTRRRGLRLPIDHLFRALAREYGSGCAGVVLSGAGSDGSAGLREIKAEDGLVIVQEPDTSSQTGMPSSAIGTGIVDCVLPISQIPAALERFASLPIALRSELNRGDDPPAEEATGQERFELDDDLLARLAALLDSRRNFDLRVYKRTTVERRVLRRMTLSGIGDATDYLQALQDDEQEQQMLMRDLLIGVTHFFRDAEAFDELQHEVIESLVDDAVPGDTLRVWVAGCATGEEAYSIGMACLEAIDRKRTRITLQLFATDLDEEALSFARTAIYPPSVADQISSERLERFFTPLEGRGYQVRSQLRDAVSFATHDLVKDPPFSRMDLVSCRNVLIYLAPRAQAHVLRTLHFALAPEAFLFLGTSESTGLQRELFGVVAKKHRIYRKLGSSQKLHLTTARRSGRFEPERTLPDPGSEPVRSRLRRSLDPGERARREVLEAWAPPTVVVTPDGFIQFAHGELGPFLRFPQGDDPSIELMPLLRPEIATRTRSVIYQCRRSNQPETAVASIESGERRRVRIMARPAPRLGERTVILSFEALADAGPSEAPAGDPAEDTRQEAVIEQLEQELQATRADLRNAVEELETSNEELRSSNEESVSMNEELQSANEELEATTEELRSLNEELTTVNAQLREKIDQLERANDDLHNFFSSTRIATLFLDESLCIKRFTPAAGELLRLTHDDIGRNIADIARELLHNGLADDARQVLADFSPVRREVTQKDGIWSRRVHSYRTEDRRVDGVVVSWLDVSDIRRTTEALRRSEARLRLAAEAANFGNFDLDLREGGSIWSPTLKTLFGLSQDAAVPHDPLDSRFVHDDDFQRVRERYLDSLDPAGDGIFGDEYRILCANGRERWVYVRARTFFDGEGGNRAAVRTVGTVLDVTERKLAEERVARSESRLRRLFDQVPALISLHDGPEHVIRYANPTCEQAVGSRDLLGLPVRTALDGLAKPDFYERLDKVYASGEPQIASSQPIDVPQGPGGRIETRHFTQVVQPWFDDQGAVTGVLFFAFDVTNEVDLRQRVERSEERLWIAKKAAGLGVYDYDVQADSIQWDERMYELWGIPPGEPISFETAMAGVHPDDRSEVLAEMSQALDPTGHGRFEAEYRVVQRDDERVRWVFATAVVTFEGGDAVRMIGTAEDVTPLKAAQVALLDSQARLERADRRKDEFIAMLGHELRNPLAAIQSASELLRPAGGSTAPAARAHDILHRQAARMVHLLDGLLDVSRIVEGKISVEMSEVDLVGIGRRAVADLEHRLDGRQIEIFTDFPEDPLLIRGDTTRLDQVLDNLLSNAVKFTDDGGRVMLSLSRERYYAVLTVSDTGEGIEETVLPEIFEPFRQGTQRPHRNQGGLGLGLALVWRLIELHGGRVDVHSDGPGHGASFTVRLPLLRSGSTGAPDAARRDGEARQALAAPLGGATRILVVEDNQDAADLLAEILRLEGHDVLLARRGRDGVEMAREHRPHVVLCDIGLPGEMNGFDVARTLRTDPALAGTKLVALSGYARQADFEESTRAGFDLHLTKPVNMERLRGALEPD